MIVGRELNRMIFIGEKLRIGNGTLYCEGSLVKKDSMRASDFELSPYILRFQYKFGKKMYDQLLLKMDCFSGLGNNYNCESKVIINFIGDLDGDNKEDFLITYQNTYKGWYYCLFSSKYAEKDKAFKELIIGAGSE